MTNLALSLIEAARMYADKPAIRLDGEVLSYAALDEASARLAELLRARGVVPGDRVAIMLPNVPEFAIVYYVVLRAGAQDGDWQDPQAGNSTVGRPERRMSRLP